MTARADQPHIGLVVEGKGDLVALPILLRKYLQSINDYRDLLGKPVPTNGISNATKPEGIEGYAATAASRPGCRGILVVLDSDDECPVERAQRLRKRIEQTIAHRYFVVLAVRNYEDWLFASIETLELNEHSVYEDGANGIARIKKSMSEKYVKPVWQPKLTHKIDINLARSRSASLDRLLERFESLRSEI